MHLVQVSPITTYAGFLSKHLVQVLIWGTLRRTVGNCEFMDLVTLYLRHLEGSSLLTLGPALLDEGLIDHECEDGVVEIGVPHFLSVQIDGGGVSVLDTEFGGLPEWSMLAPNFAGVENALMMRSFIGGFVAPIIRLSARIANDYLRDYRNPLATWRSVIQNPEAGNSLRTYHFP